MSFARNLTLDQYMSRCAKYTRAMVSPCGLRASTEVSRTCDFRRLQLCHLRHNCLKSGLASPSLFVSASNLQSRCRMAASHSRTESVEIPLDEDDAEVRVGRRTVRLTHLRKKFFPSTGATKGDLLRYYASIAPWLLPHLRDRAMVMKRYPNGANGKCFFMKRAPSPRPEWIQTCDIEHDSGNVIDFPIVQDLASLLWVVNLGCIDLNQWYSRCDDVDRPDYLHFDLDPARGAGFPRVLEVALIVRDALHELGMTSFVKTSGATGVHVYVPIKRGPLQKQVWTFAKEIARVIATTHPKIATAEYIIAKRPYGRVFVDYNQNAWGKTLASIYSVRPARLATVSTPVTWDEIEAGVDREAFRIDTVPDRVARLGDLWAGLLSTRGRVNLESLL
jgi:bifunctional non-homologous end joining protein LigD